MTLNLVGVLSHGSGGQSSEIKVWEITVLLRLGVGVGWGGEGVRVCALPR